MKCEGKWITVHPTDCYTLVPVYQCSNCGKLVSGYEPARICTHCGSDNEIDKDNYIAKPIFNETF